MSPVARLVSTLALVAVAAVLNGRYQAAIKKLVRRYMDETTLAYRLSEGNSLKKWLDARGHGPYVLWMAGTHLCLLAALSVVCGVFP